VPTASTTVPASSIGSYAANVVSFLHFDGDLTDTSGKIWTPSGTAAASTVRNKTGSGSLYLDGGSYLSGPTTADFDFGSGDFTIDWWEYRTQSVQWSGLFMRRIATSAAGYSSPYYIFEDS